MNIIKSSRGAGFLGLHVVRLLLQENNIVTVFDYSSSWKMEHFEAVGNHANLKIIRGDIQNIEEVKHAFKDSQIIIHREAVLSIFS